MSSGKFDASYYDTLTKEAWVNAVDVLTNAYGKPTDAPKTYPSFTSMNAGYVRYTHVWMLPTKIVRIGVEANNKSEYYTVITITHRATEEAMAAEKKKAAEEAKKKSAGDF